MLFDFKLISRKKYSPYLYFIYNFYDLKQLLFQTKQIYEAMKFCTYKLKRCKYVLFYFKLIFRKEYWPYLYFLHMKRSEYVILLQADFQKGVISQFVIFQTKQTYIAMKFCIICVIFLATYKIPSNFVL